MCSGGRRDPVGASQHALMYRTTKHETEPSQSTNQQRTLDVAGDSYSYTLAWLMGRNLLVHGYAQDL